MTSCQCHIFFHLVIDVTMCLFDLKYPLIIAKLATLNRAHCYYTTVPEKSSLFIFYKNYNSWYYMVDASVEFLHEMLWHRRCLNHISLLRSLYLWLGLYSRSSWFRYSVIGVLEGQCSCTSYGNAVYCNTVCSYSEVKGINFWFF